MHAPSRPSRHVAPAGAGPFPSLRVPSLRARALAFAGVALVGACSDGGGGATGATGGAGDGEGLEGEAGNALVSEGRRFALERAIAIDHGPAGGHYRVELGVTDSYYTTYSVAVGNVLVPFWVAPDNAVELRAELFSPGADGFRFGQFDFAAGPDGDLVDAIESASPELAGRALFGDGYVGVDLDGSGEVEEHEEVAIGGGTLAIGPFGGGFDLAFEVVLVDGRRASGRYAGEALLVE